MAGMSGAGAGTVALTAAQIRQFGITFGTVETRPLTSEVRTAGVVTFDESKMAQVAPKIGGFVERLHVNFTGQPVRRGQPLLEIYSPELVAAQQELLVVGDLQRDIGRSAVPGVPEDSANLVEAAKRRLRLWDISEPHIDEVLKTRRARRTLTLDKLLCALFHLCDLGTRKHPLRLQPRRIRFQRIALRPERV